LPALIQKAIREREITMGHARAIINVEDPDTQIMLYKQIVKYDFSVRKIEEIVRKINNEEKKRNLRSQLKFLSSLKNTKN
jgi:ParB family chromosome partitioning protein